jgi:hypothetical protein
MGFYKGRQHLLASFPLPKPASITCSHPMRDAPCVSQSCAIPALTNGASGPVSSSATATGQAGAAWGAGERMCAGCHLRRRAESMLKCQEYLWWFHRVWWW